MADEHRGAEQPTVDWNIRHLAAEYARIDAYIAYAVQRWQAAGQHADNLFRGLVVTDEEADKLLSLPFSGNWGAATEVGAGVVEGLAAVRSQALATAQQIAEQTYAAGQIPRLDYLAERFGLDEFEVDALLLVYAPAFDLRYEQLYGYLQNDATRRRASVNLVLDVLCAPEPERLQLLAYFADNGALVKHRLLQRTAEAGGGPTPLLSQVLLPDPTVAAWLLGDYAPSPELSVHVRLFAGMSGPQSELLAPSIQAQLTQAAALDEPLLLLFSGPDRAAQEAAGLWYAHTAQRPLLRVAMDEIVADGANPRQILHLTLRDALLNGAVALLSGWEACLQDNRVPSPLLDLLYEHPDAVIVAGEKDWLLHSDGQRRLAMRLEFGLPDYAQRRALWRSFLAQLGPAVSDVDIEALAGQFSLTTTQVRDAIATARDAASQVNEPVTQAHLFRAVRAHSSPKLSGLARKIEPRYGWDDIILPADQIQVLRELVATVRHRSLVLEEWGLGAKLASSAAVTVLFAGPPGTGKTMAAEVIAGDLGLDLYKIDLSSLVDKYIGETEKNLERVFTEAQSSNAILFFDEADAIFGKRSGVKDARDRYANMEVSYLLQRMESYDGVTILATNLRSNMDEAFLRRLQFAVDIPFPDEKDRLRIWQTLMPDTVPQAGNLELEEFAQRFKMAGGNIRNVIVSAAYLAAADGGVLTKDHLHHGVRRELQKMGRLLPEARAS
jgi:ATP-dependent 26S proteasome regulatory subunit